MSPALRKIVINARQDGFKWRVVRGELEVRSGSAGTRDEAEADAEAALKELEAKGEPVIID